MKNIFLTLYAVRLHIARIAILAILLSSLLGKGQMYVQGGAKVVMGDSAVVSVASVTIEKAKNKNTKVAKYVSAPLKKEKKALTKRLSKRVLTREKPAKSPELAAHLQSSEGSDRFSSAFYALKNAILSVNSDFRSLALALFCTFIICTSIKFVWEQPIYGRENFFYSVFRKSHSIRPPPLH